MPNTFDSIPAAITQRALARNFSVEEKARREAMLLNKNFYYGKQEESLNLVNEDVEPLTLNLTKPIIKKRATLLYRTPLVREFEGPSESITFLEGVYNENSIDALLLQTDLASELTGTALLLPEQVSNSLKFPSGIRLRLFDASSISVIPDEEDVTEPAAISLIKVIDVLSKISTPANPQVERKIIQQIWTEQSVTTWDGSMLTGTETNELGFLPFTNFHGEIVHDQYLGHAPATNIRTLNEDVNQLLTNLGYMVQMQSATPIALAGYASGEGITIHPGRAFSVPAGATATVLNLNPKIEETLELVKYLEEKLFETSSVPKVSVIGGEGKSGRELLVRWFPILTVFQEKAVRWERYELALANTILRVAGKPLIESIKIDYPERDVLPLSCSDDTLTQDIKLNIVTAIDEIKRRNPEMDETEANAELLANKEINDMTTNRTDVELDKPTEEEE